MALSPAFQTIRTNGVNLRCVVEGDGPLVLMIHGWPESWYSWRHQIGPVRDAGYRVVVPDVRGYGGSDAPRAIEAYDMESLIGDVLGLIDHFGERQAILFGHDWGAPIVWNTTALHPDRVRAVAALSVPYSPRGKMSSIELWRQIYAGRFFYSSTSRSPGWPKPNSKPTSAPPCARSITRDVAIHRRACFAPTSCPTQGCSTTFPIRQRCPDG